ncbi:DUF3545 family protein [Shewanella sp. VB17]|uniref:DUF3545 family protein n=1 Tax=Shewanella sp. VB17 TaxID=2739432 RepID=UPI00156568C0|nr:DUF3545 family protein [Shewanella sp. VB17]NRD73112.1 DUF3545 family protein [Shewanella sp. VB17]
MNRLDYGSALDDDSSLDVVVERPSPSKSTNKKRRWREIEAIKEKYRLLNELRDIDESFKYEIDNL